MITLENTITVRYDEVDKMGYVFHGNYSKYYQIGKTELLRKIGICDIELEKIDIIMPVIDMNIRYIKPLHYQDIIRIRTILKEVSRSRLKFHYKLFNQQKELVNEADNTIVFVDNNFRKPIRLPMILFNKIKASIIS